MADYRTMFDSNYVRSWDLGGKARTVVIERVEVGTLKDHKTNATKKMPHVWFKGAKKPLGLNKTNSKTIATMYGNDTAQWIGKAITIYPTKTSVGGTETDCIRVKPQKPTGPAADLPDVGPPPVPENVDPQTGEVKS